MNLAQIVIRANKLETEFPVGSIWSHLNGRLYKVLGVANVANACPKHRPVIVYRSVTPTERAILPSRLWTKTPADFRRKMTRIVNNSAVSITR